jgi:CheY-like chemotaxis protein
LLSKIRRGTNALNAQLRDLLTLARGDVGKMEMNPMAFEVNELMESVAREVRPEAELKGLELIVELPPEPTFVVADPARIDQVLTNLLTNATRHTQQGSIRLKLEPYDTEHRCLRFDVSDTGPGIREESLPTLFEPYTRFGELNGGGEGAGLGLAIVRSVLHFLGGTVDVHSTLDQGTTFGVKIPAEPVSGAVGAETHASRQQVLVVDDRQEVLEGLVGVIRQLGYECDTALSVGSAANLLGARPYGTVLLDMEMPVKRGRDVAIDVRRGDGPNKTSRIISISAADVPENQQGWPFDGHLTKPISMQAIQRVIAAPASAATPPR